MLGALLEHLDAVGMAVPLRASHKEGQLR
jgi:hypothetical protein